MSFGSHAQGTLLAQNRPTVTTQIVLFTATLRTEISRLVVCNNTGSGAAFRLYHTIGAAAAVIANAVYYGKVILLNDTLIQDGNSIGAGFAMARADRIVIESLTANALTFHLYGVTETLAERVRPMGQG